MHMLTLPSSLRSEVLLGTLTIRCWLTARRQHQVVISNPAAVFVYVGQALEADALGGQTAVRVVTATKRLLEATGTDGASLLQQNFTPEAQQLIRGYFG